MIKFSLLLRRCSSFIQAGPALHTSQSTRTLYSLQIEAERLNDNRFIELTAS